MYLITQITPQVVSETDLSLLAVGGTATASGVHRLIHSVNICATYISSPARLSR